ncbi:sugar phosphate nucleotidyltransferase [Streptomyces sp. NPDC019531]|uniref:sugar phosphate nucleotidyltransferase n=1 Tax=Streptomyces sp. NPDC019531 TaxID=3365062 RepID=UPI00384C9FE8
MKALVLSGGAGSRLRPIMHASAEQLVPVADKAVLFHGRQSVAVAGIPQVGGVVGDNCVTNPVDEFRLGRPDARIPLTRIQDPRLLSGAGLGPDGRVTGLEEMREQPESDLRGVVEVGASVANPPDVEPAASGACTHVRDSRVGPFASMTENCRAVAGQVEFSPPRAHRVVPGDHSKVRIPS